MRHPDLNQALNDADSLREEGSLRPQSLNEFIGQEALKQNLRIFIAASRKRNQAMDHVLLHGPPGLGKTTLAQLMARELGVGFRTTSGPILARAGDLAAILTGLEDRDVLFIDEIHRMHPAVEEILYPAMEDQKLDIMIGEGVAARSVQVDLPSFTLVGATTRTGLLTNPLRDRFGIPLRLEFYNDMELQLIVKRLSVLFQFKITDDGAMEIARRSRGTPRIAGRLTRRVRDFADVMCCPEVTKDVANDALNQLDVDHSGLDRMDRAYLLTLAEHYKGGPVGADTIAAALSEQKDVVEEVIEPYLMQQGFIQRTPRGRVLTEKAWLHLGLSATIADLCE